MTGVEVNGCIGSTVMYVQLFLFKFLLNLRISHVSISLSIVFFLISLKHLVLLIYTPPFFLAIIAENVIKIMNLTLQLKPTWTLPHNE